MINETLLKGWLEYCLNDETVTEYSLVYHWLLNHINNADKRKLIKDCDLEIEFPYKTVLGEQYPIATVGDIKAILGCLDDVRLRLDFDDGVIPVIILPWEWVKGILAVEYLENETENYFFELLSDHYASKGDRAIPVHLTASEYTTLYRMYKR